MGAVEPFVRLQGGCQTLSEGESLVASVVPDVSGIDKTFDYIVPARLGEVAQVGCRVRVPLNGRRVSGWIVAISSGSQAEHSRLLEVVSVSGQSVEPDVVPLALWVAQEWFGSRRAVLSAASSPRVRERPTAPRMGRDVSPPGDEVANLAAVLLGGDGGLLVVPPLASALSVVALAASRGPVLVVCPTVRMVRMGSAALRRRGFTTAELPDQWEIARAGVDIVIGARSAVFGPCRGLSCVVVIDEHEEVLQEERIPSWNARDVAIERARRAHVPVIATSPTPSAASRIAFGDSVRIAGGVRTWPSMVVEDISRLPVAGSLLGEQLLADARRTDLVVACVLNTTGVARLIACVSCSRLQMCPSCGHPLEQSDDGEMWCGRCDQARGSVCRECGRAKFRVVTGGVGLLSRQLRKATNREVVEVTAETEESLVGGGLAVGTDALLNRLASADVVVFCDVDRDVMAPRTSAPRDALAMVARAARLVGPGGRIVLQTRTPSHPLMVALAGADPVSALEEWSESEVVMRRELGLPPFCRMVRVVGVGEPDIARLRDAGCDVAVQGDSAFVRHREETELRRCIEMVRGGGSSVRVYADPSRY